MLRKTLNSEIMKNSSGRVRVAKKKFGSGRVAGTRQSLVPGGQGLGLQGLGGSRGWPAGAQGDRG